MAATKRTRPDTTVRSLQKTRRELAALRHRVEMLEGFRRAQIRRVVALEALFRSLGLMRPVGKSTRSTKGAA